MMKKVLVFTVFFLGGMAHGQALNKSPQESARAAVKRANLRAANIAGPRKCLER
jgi:hypothetical protein